jgi:two-component system cell cycle sensor histidine kinase/response regulator CckA
MEAIGQLAGGIAHDFNNLLTVIKGNCEISLLDSQEDDPLRDNINDIEKAAQRAADLTRQLLAFSRRQILEMQVVDLNNIIERVEKMLRRVIGEDIELKIILAGDEVMVKIDPGQIEQVIMNLCVNARDAMPKGGNLTIETAPVEVDETHAASHPDMIPGWYVMFSVRDTGVGMTPVIMEQIFNPFFTTKEAGRGTGLGLATVYGIVKQSKGNIFVYSEVGKGTTFKIYLPRSFASADELKEGESKEVSRGKETILVVEDEETVRNLTVDFLRKHGYTVLEATDGRRALVIFKQRKGPIHLVLTDVVMPKMSGPELIQRLKKTGKDFKVLYMSGYAEATVMHHALLKNGVELINKPFRFDKLAQRVREILDKE